MAKTRLVHQVKLLRRDSVTPHLARVVLGGDDLRRFPSGFEGGYVKLLFSPEERMSEEGTRHQGSAAPNYEGAAAPKPNGEESPREEAPIRRSFTVQRFDPQACELELWMVEHKDGGPAATWLSDVEVGSLVHVTDPGAVRAPSPEADWFLLAGDLSAFSALSVMLRRLPDDAVGFAVLEGTDDSDQLALVAPPGIDITWVSNPDPQARRGPLVDAVKGLPWRAGRVSVWVAGEFGTARQLRQYFRQERGVARQDLYASCYWMVGETDEGMKRAKRADTVDW